jgi:WD40-like Beta Propeller Repeat
MKPSRNLMIGAGALALLAGAALLLALARPQKAASWTDGDAIRIPAERAPVREVLWRPAEPFKVAGADDEYEPRYSADGTTVIFVRGRPGHNADLFTSRWTPAGWSQPAPIASINTDHDELGPELSRDGTSLYFYSDRPGGLGGYDLWVSRKEGESWGSWGSWGTPTNLGPSINSRWNEYGPALSPDGARLYFSSNRPRPGEPIVNADSWSATVREHRTRHDYDLYAADLSTTADAKPLESLNTTGDEGAPAISPAGDFLYFASDRPGGLGGFDIYRSRLSRTGTPGPIDNLGPAINSDANDLDPALSAEGFRLTFSSDRKPPAASPDQADPPTPTPVTAPTADPGRYSLWTSTSREVYRDLETRERDLSALSKLWPWLLLLLLTLLPLYALYRLLRDEAWRRRFRRLSLLAQCLLLSLLLHAGIASVMSILKVGSGIINLVHNGGGTRVILASGAPSGSLAAQIRGSLADAPLNIPPLAVVTAAAPTSPIETISATIPMADLTAPPVPTARAAVPEPSERQTSRDTPEPHRPADLVSATPKALTAAPVAAEPAPRDRPEVRLTAAPQVPVPSTAPVNVLVPSLEAPSTTAPLAVDPALTNPSRDRPVASKSLPAEPTNATRPAPAALPTIAASAPTSEASSRGTPGAPPSPLAPSVTSSAPSRVDVPIAPLTGRNTAGDSAARVAVADSDRPAPTSTAPLTDPAPATSTPGARPDAVTLPTIAAAKPAAEPSGTFDPHAGLAPTSAPAPSVPAAPDVRIDLPVASMSPKGAPGAAAPLPTAFETKNPARNSPSGPLTSPAPAARANGAESPLPAVAPPTSRSTQTAEPQSPAAATTNALGSLPAPIAANLGTGTPTTSVVINPGELPAGKPAPATPLEAPAESRSSTRDRGPSLPAPPSLAAPATTSGPQIPVGIPTPVETFAQRAPESRADLVERMGGSPQTERAVGLALDWFLRHQSKDGHWSAEHFDDACHECDSPAEFKADAAMTGMVLLCYLGAGHTHLNDGPYRDAVNNGLQWLVKRQANDGDLRRGETMYGQTAGAVALCEAFAMTRDAKLAEPARKAVEFVLTKASQASSTSKPDPRDTSVIGWLVFTVESARRAGFAVPQATFDSARSWLSQVTTPSPPGAYAYAPGGPSSPAMTAEAMFVQQLLGRTRDERLMQQSARYILQSPPRWREGAPTYYWYYATLALFQHQGESWRTWNDRLVPELLAHQEQTGKSAGSWAPTDPWSRMGGRVYQTAACTLCLEVYYRYKAR